MGGGREWRVGEEGTCWDEHWVLYGNQFDNKFHILKKNLEGVIHNEFRLILQNMCGISCI